MNKIVVGFDPPSICNLGYSIFSVDDKLKKIKMLEAGLVSLQSKYDEEIFDYDFAVKTAKLEDFLLDFYINNVVQEIVVEQQILGTHSNKFMSPFLIAQTNNMSVTIQRMAYRKNIERHLIHNKTLKKNISGSGNAKKTEVMEKVINIMGFEMDYEGLTEKKYIKNYEHVFDSIALVLGKYMGFAYEPLKYENIFKINRINI